jgi:hypothetical protein
VNLFLKYSLFFSKVKSFHYYGFFLQTIAKGKKHIKCTNIDLSTDISVGDDSALFNLKKNDLTATRKVVSNAMKAAHFQLQGNARILTITFPAR